MVDVLPWLLSSSAPLASTGLGLFNSGGSLLAETSEAELEPLVLASVLLSLITVYLAAKIGGELCARVNLPSVLGELVSGVI
ncbi:MAG: cation:proton antiporter, partial [Cyanobacteria bacterium]|nr:cation:proton antiporter [Cyanobacteriota bacterium]